MKDERAFTPPSTSYVPPVGGNPDVEYKALMPKCANSDTVQSLGYGYFWYRSIMTAIEDLVIVQALL